MLKLRVTSTPSTGCVHLVDAVECGLVSRRVTHRSLSTQALLGSSRSMHELKGDILAVVPDNWEAPVGSLANRYGQFQAGGRLYREQLLKRFLVSGATDFSSWVRRQEFTTHYWGRVQTEAQDGRVFMVDQWLPRARTGDATYLVAGAERADVRRSERRVAAAAPAPAPAPEPMLRDELDEGYDPPGWDEGKRTWTALKEILRTNPSLVGETSFEGRIMELQAFATRLKAKDASADDVILRDAAFRWGDDEWAQWHLDNDSSDDDEEMGVVDPFSEENVPPATAQNRQAIRDLFKRRFTRDAPIRATFQSKLFGDFLGYLRQCIVRNVYP